MESNTEKFISDELIRTSKLFATKHKPHFPTKEFFSNWYVKKLEEQNFRCYYCDTSIFDIRKLIYEKKLLARKIGYGFRGPVFEVDKMNNSLGYSPTNCVLSCYYCNNDKSYTLNSEDYKIFFGSGRKAFFDYLLQL